MRGHRATVVRALAALLTVPFLAGCYITAAPDDTQGLPKGTPDVVTVRTPDQPRVGSCHQSTYAVFEAKTAVTTEVDCSSPHTTQTVYVGEYPEPLAAAAKRFNSVPIVKYAVPRCFEEVAAFLGGTRAQLASSLFSPTIYFADADRFARGEHWFRCDVALAQFGPKTLLPLPASAAGTLAQGGVPDEYVGCLAAGYDKPSAEPPTVACSGSHAAVPTGTLTSGGPATAFPSDRALQTRAARDCDSQVRAWAGRTNSTPKGYAWRAPSKAMWDILRERTTVCYAITS